MSSLQQYSGVFLSPRMVDYVQYIKSIPLLSYEEERHHFLEYKKNHSEASAKVIIKAHLRLAFSVAYAFCRKTKASFEDALSEANLGLLKALDSFNPNHEKRARFSTYAVFWIKANLYNWFSKTLSCCSLTNSPRVKKIASSLSKIYASKGVISDDDCREISTELSVDQYEVTSSYSALVKPVSIYDPTTPEGKTPLYEKISLETPDEDFEEKREVFLKSLSVLTDKERDIILKRYHGDTLASIGEQLGISRERVRQLFDRALSKIQSSIKEMGF